MKSSLGSLSYSSSNRLEIFSNCGASGKDAMGQTGTTVAASPGLRSSDRIGRQSYRPRLATKLPPMVGSTEAQLTCLLVK